MLFGKKHKEERPVPIEEIQLMNGQGLSDKEIIKKLKKKGFSYPAIERAMLEAVKKGVSDVPEIASSPEPESFGIEEFYDNRPMQQEAQIPDVQVDEMLAPETIIEELIEGVIEEKWEKFDAKIKLYEADLEKIATHIKQFEMKVQDIKKEPMNKEYDVKIEMMSNNIEELEARIGGLEKAFKQFLPSLTKNIENLSSMIHEMKEKHGMRQHETFA